MNVLISGGDKTINIFNALNDRFASGGVKIQMENNIYDIENVITRGDYFDKAIIMEQSWTDDGRNTDQSVMRNRIYSLCLAVNTRCGKDTILIFVATTERMARMACEESIGLGQRSIVIIKAPKYPLIFFVDLISKDRDQLGDNIVYTMESFSKPTEAEEITQWSQVRDIEESTGFGDKLTRTNDVDMSNIVVVDRINDDTKQEESEVQLNLWDDSELFDSEQFNFDGLDSGISISVEGDEQDDIDGLEYLDGIDETEDNIGDDNDKSIEVHDDTEEVVIEHKNDIPGALNDDIYTDKAILEQLEDMEDEKSIEEDIDDTGINLFSTKEEDDLQPKQMNILLEQSNSIGTHENKKKKDNKSYEDDIIHRIKIILDTYTNRGGSMVITGAGGSGVSVVAFNLANVINRLGYTVLVVDLDTKWKAQSFLSKDSYDAIHINDVTKKSLISALGISGGASKYANIIRPGLHVLSMGIDEDLIEYGDIADKSRMSRLDIAARSSYQFVIYDMPFDVAMNSGSNITETADYITMVCDTSNWGVMKMMLALANIDNRGMQETMFRRAVICYNKFNNVNNLLGRKVRSLTDIGSAADNIIKQTTGISFDLQIANMQISRQLSYIRNFEDCWFRREQLSDFPDGARIFTELLMSIFIPIA